MKVLLIEDNKTDAMIVTSLLRSRGLTVLSASNLKKALARIEQELPDVVVSALCLPDGEGSKIVRALREALPNASLIVYSGAEPSEPLAEVDAFLPKDALRGATLEWVMRHAMARRAEWVELLERVGESDLTASGLQPPVKE